MLEARSPYAYRRQRPANKSGKSGELTVKGVDGQEGAGRTLTYCSGSG